MRGEWRGGGAETWGEVDEGGMGGGPAGGAETCGEVVSGGSAGEERTN